MATLVVQRRVDRVPSQRKVDRHVERERTDGPAIDVTKTVFMRMRQRSPATVLELHPCRDRGSVDSVRLELPMMALAGHDDGWQRSSPGAVGHAIPGGGSARFGRGVNVDRGKNAGERVAVNDHPVATLREVLRGDAERAGQIGDLGCGREG